MYFIEPENTVDITESILIILAKNFNRIKKIKERKDIK